MCVNFVDHFSVSSSVHTCDPTTCNIPPVSVSWDEPKWSKMFPIQLEAATSLLHRDTIVSLSNAYLATFTILADILAVAACVEQREKSTRRWKSNKKKKKTKKRELQGKRWSQDRQDRGGKKTERRRDYSVHHVTREDCVAKGHETGRKPRAGGG